MEMDVEHDGTGGADTVDPGQAADPRELFTIVVTECPRCDRSQSVRVRNTVDAVAEPALKQQLLARTLMAHDCVGCGHSYQIAYDFLYLDPSHNLAIVLSASTMAQRMAESAAVQPGQRRRLVASWAELVEKILLFDAGLDDHVIELVKLGVCRQLIARYAGVLAKITAKPLDLSRVSFRSIDRSAPGGDQIEFLVLSSPRWLPLSIRAPYDAFARHAETRVTELAAEQVSLAPLEWLIIDPAWALRTVGGLENVPAIEAEIQVAFDPARTIDVGTRAFFETRPTVPPGTRRLIWLPKSESRAWRPQHYYFAHRRLRAAFEDPEQWVGALHSLDRYRFVRRLWDEVTKACVNEGRPARLRADGIKVYTAWIQRYPTAIIEMTPPSGYCEAFFVALVLRRIGLGEGECINEVPMLAYYTLELGQKQDDSPCTYLCEWKADGSRRNYGLGPAPTLDDFLEAVTAHVRETAVVRSPLPPVVVRR